MTKRGAKTTRTMEKKRSTWLLVLPLSWRASTYRKESPAAMSESPVGFPTHAVSLAETYLSIRS